MTLDRTRTATGRALRWPSLAPLPIRDPANLIFPDPGVTPGAGLLSPSGEHFFSQFQLGAYRWGRVLVEWPAGVILPRTEGSAPSFTIRRSAPGGAPLAADQSMGEFSWASVSQVGDNLFLSEPTGRVRCSVDGTPAAGSLPTRIEFFTTPAGSTTALPRLRVTSDGNVLIGNTTGVERLDVTGNIRASQKVIANEIELTGLASGRDNFVVNVGVGGPPFRPRVQVEGTGNDGSAITVTRSENSAAAGSRVILGRTRGSTVGASAAVQAGDGVGTLLFSASDGSFLYGGAAVSAFVSSAPVTGTVPMWLTFRTRSIGDAGVAERARVTETGNFLIGNTTGTERLSVTGNVQLTNTANSFMVGGNPVLGSRKTGWTAPVGTARRSGFNTATATLQEVAETLKALIDDHISHGTIGPA